MAGGQSVGVLGALDSLVDGQQGGELVPGPSRIPGLSGPVGEVVAGVEGSGMLGAQDPFADGQQGGELVPSPSRIPGLPSPVGEIVAGGQGGGVLEAVNTALPVRVGDLPEQVPGCCATAAMAEGLRDLPEAIAGQIKNGAACGRSTADTGHAVESFGSVGTAPSSRAAAASSHWDA